MTDYTYINDLFKRNIIYNDDKQTIWTMYNKYFNTYPSGKITCSSCVINSIIQLKKHLTLKQLLNG